MAMDKNKLAEKLKGLSPEDRTMFREVLTEIDPPEPDTETVLTGDEVSALRELLAKRTKKKTGILDALDSLFE